MAFLSGEILTASRLNRLRPVIYSATSTADLAVTTTSTDVPGATVTFSTSTANAVYYVNTTFDISQLATTNNDCFGKLSIDGVEASATAPFGGQVLGDRVSGGQVWTGTISSSGSHTFKLRAVATAASQYQVNSPNTTIMVMVFEVP